MKNLRAKQAPGVQGLLVVTMLCTAFIPSKPGILRHTQCITQNTRKKKKGVHVGKLGAYMYILGVYVYIIPLKIIKWGKRISPSPPVGRGGHPREWLTLSMWPQVDCSREI